MNKFQFSGSEPEAISPIPSTGLNEHIVMETSAGSNIESEDESRWSQLPTSDYMTEAFRKSTKCRDVKEKLEIDFSVSRN